MSIYPKVFLNTICKIIGNIYKKLSKHKKIATLLSFLIFWLSSIFHAKKFIYFDSIQTILYIRKDEVIFTRLLLY